MPNINKKSGAWGEAVVFLAACPAYVWGLAAAVTESLGFQWSAEFPPLYATGGIQGPLWLYLCALLTLLMLRLLLHNRITLGIFMSLSVLTILLVWLGDRSSPGFIMARNDAFTLIRGVGRYVTGYENLQPAYEYSIGLILVLFFSLLSVALCRFRFGFYGLIGIALVVNGICYYMSEPDSAWPLIVCTAGLFVLFAWHAGDDKRYAPVMAAVPLVILCFTLSMFIPVYSRENAFMLRSFLSKPFDHISDALYPVFARKYFSFKNTGYVGPQDRLGGDIRLSGRVVMEVASKEPLYLAGAYRDTYTGHAWIDSSVNAKTELFTNIGVLGETALIDYKKPSVELLEMAFSNLLLSLDNGEIEFFGNVLENPALIKESPYNERCTYVPDGVFTIEMQLSPYRRQEAIIYIKDAPTFSLFMPEMAAGVMASAQMHRFTEKDGTLTSDALIGIGQSYGIQYRKNPSKQIGYWYNILRSSRRGVFNEIREAFEQLHETYSFHKNQLTVNLDETRDSDPFNLHMLNMYPADAVYFDPGNAIAYEDFLIDTLIPRAEEIYRRYTALPDYFPDRIKQLAEDVTRRLDTNYYKAFELMNFLKQYPYTLMPGEVPEDRDFVDYFLFDAQKGYCTYYASAFVTMCRAIGIPARYVEGYVTPDKPAENGLYLITNRQAHAWAEVYFEGYGWVRFDPTPLEGVMEVKPEISALKDTYPAADEKIFEPVSVTVPADTEVLSESPELIDDTGANDNIQAVNAGISTGGYGATGLSGGAAAYKTDRNGIFIKNFLLAILILIFIMAAYIALRVRSQELQGKNLRRLQGNEAAKAYGEKYVRLLVRLGVPVKETETYHQWAEHARAVISSESTLPDLQALAELFSRASYGADSLTGKEIGWIRGAVTLTEAYVRESLGAFRYFHLKYIKGVL